MHRRILVNPISAGCLALCVVTGSLACVSKAGDAADAGAQDTAAGARGGPAAADSIPAVAAQPGAQPGSQQEPQRPGLRFDPSTATYGRRFGDVTVAAVDVQRAVALPDSPYVGRVRFSGKMTLTGKLMKHPDADNKSVCFEADNESALKIPRMITDNRRSWMCFTNDAAAHEMVSGIPAESAVRITIRDYVTSYSASDAYNSAGLLSAEVVK